MILWASWWCLLLTTLVAIQEGNAADDDYNVIHRDGSFQFGYETPDSYHHADGNRNNVVRGEFGGRNPATGRIDSTVYTAGPRGYRPRGKNIHRKYSLNQSGPRPSGSYDDPYEDPSYSFAFRTRTYNRQETANRFGDVSGKYNYIDDVGEPHNVEFIAGKNTGFHVKTPFPDSNPRSYYGRLYFRGRGKPIPRGRTSIQRGLDGSYRFVSVGPDQRRTETSDASGHVRGSYTYLDDKGVQHSVHYIAGPETGYRVLKNVKGPHLPTIYPFEGPDLYDYGKDPGDVFDTAATAHAKPNNNKNNVGERGKIDDKDDGDIGTSGGDGEDFGDLFDTPSGSTPRPARPTKPSGSGNPGGNIDDGSYKPPTSDGDTGDDGTYIPPGDVNQDDGSYKPGPDEHSGDYDDSNDLNLFGSETNSRTPNGRPTNVIQVQGDSGGGTSGDCERCRGTIVTNVGDRIFSVPPGVSVRAHVQSIDLLPLLSKVPSPSEQYNEEMGASREQLRSAASDLVSSNETSVEVFTETTTLASTTVEVVTDSTIVTTKS